MLDRLQQVLLVLTEPGTNGSLGKHVWDVSLAQISKSAKVGHLL